MKRPEWLSKLIGKPTFTPETLAMLHRRSFRNKEMINQLIKLDPKEEFLKIGCFYCRSKMYPSRIKEYTKDGTAICPICRIDSIIPLTVYDERNKADNLLDQMNDRYFGDKNNVCCKFGETTDKDLGD
jgi:hypothetical protein